MPCIKCSNGKWRIGDGKCQYKTKENCEKALAAYYAQRRGPFHMKTPAERLSDSTETV